MQNKILNLKLKYKNKYLDIARYKRDFDNQFYLGSDKNLLWQILDDSFPEKFKLINRRKDRFELKLWEDMDILVKEGDQILSKQQLKEEGLLEDGVLQLQQNQMGRIKFLDNWEIEYSFTKPYRMILTEAEKQIAKTFATFTKLSSQEKFTRIFIFLGMIFTIGGLLLFEAGYQPPEVVGLADRLSRIEDIATRVEVAPVEEVEPQETTYTRREAREEEVTQQVRQAARMTSEEFESEFGLSLDASLSGGSEEELNNQLLEITEVQEIVSSGDGSNVTSTPKITRGASELDVISSKVELGDGDGLGDLGGLEGIDLDSESGFEEIDLANLGGNMGQYNVTKIGSKKKFEEIKKRFSGIKMMQEGNIEIKEMAPQEKTQLAHIDKIVSAYKPQIVKLFTTESMMIDMYGSLEFALIISPSGQVEAVDIKQIEGSYFTPTFINKCREIILNWDITVQEAVGYSFRMKFYK
ncbi:MAG: hypothetical protein K9N09_08835 [Candidatus Cloacimonetes bacterium]|nr:hypothetical protein [Candidatus Cloacimonadota bacterium]MCF7814441.1 hypothetical protein [Candidatus Cloacimonadota bacterium]MCF7868791.1 hypothetical protein [Candidatus Cloacimonadota bacterium]